MIEKSEFRSRIERFARLIRDAGFNGAFLTAESNIAYFSGFRSHAPWMTFARPNFLAISADGRAAMLGSGFVEPEMRRMSVVGEVRTYSQAKGVPIPEILSIFSDLGMRGGVIGMELGYEQRIDLSQLDFQSLVDACKPDSVQDVSGPIWAMRMIKSPAEIEKLRTACDITGTAILACFEAARPGMTERELSRIAANVMVQRGAERPGFILVTSGAGNYGMMSGKATDRALQRGDLLWMDMGAVFDGYWSDFCRTAYLGERRPELDSDQNLIIDVNAAAIDTIAVGRPMRDIAAAAMQAFKKHGMEIKLGPGRIGHGIGLMSTEPPHLALFDDTICAEGLVFTVEPRFVRNHGLFNCEEIIVVTSKGAEFLTTTPRDITYI